MSLDIIDYVQSEIFLNGSYEPLSLSLFQRSLLKGDTAIDVGANVGQYSIAAASRVGHSGTVVAIESNPAAAAHLLRNRSLNNYENLIKIVTSPIASRSLILEFGVPHETALGVARISDQTGSDTFFASAVALVDVFRHHKITKAKTLKIDVEGMEIEIITSILDAPKKFHPDNILFEFIPSAFNYGMSTLELISYLNSRNYQIQTVDGRNFTGEQPIPEDNLWATLKNDFAAK